MKIIFGKKETIFDKLMDAVTECAIDDKRIIKEFHLEPSEYRSYLKMLSGLEVDMSKKHYFQGIEVKKVPKYDLFHDGEYWIEHDLDLDYKLSASGVNVTHAGQFMILNGKTYRAGDPAPVKSDPEPTEFKTESEGISIGANGKSYRWVWGGDK